MFIKTKSKCELTTTEKWSNSRTEYEMCAFNLVVIIWYIRRLIDVDLRVFTIWVGTYQGKNS